jgi:hypothetical protein
MANRVFVSPGVYTSELDLTFVAKQVGVTTLGIVGETPKGPAFEPVFISGYDEFQTIFGGLDPTLFRGTGYPKFEANYIAKGYLTQSSQLFITRILGLSGYDAGDAWSITIDAALDPSTVDCYSTGTTTSTFTVTTGGTITSFVFAGHGAAELNAVFADGGFDSYLTNLEDSIAFVTTLTADTQYTKTGTVFNGGNYNLLVVAAGSDGLGNITGSTTGTSVICSGTSYSDVEDLVVATLRSEATYSSNEIINFEVSGSGIVIDPSNTDILNDPYATFFVSGNTTGGDSIYFETSMDKTKKNYLVRVLGKEPFQNQLPLYVEEIYDNMLANLVDQGKVKGLNISFEYVNDLDNYLTEYRSALTPWVVSEVRGNKVFRLFRFITISDGDAANRDIKISIQNINLDDLEFDVVIRDFNDTDANPVILERFSKCSMDSTSTNYVARRIGTNDGFFPLRSSRVMVEMADNLLEDAIPAGFEGFEVREYNSALPPIMNYKTSYLSTEKVRKVYLGVSNIAGIDQDMFDFKGLQSNVAGSEWTGVTKGFHMDINATGVTVDGQSSSITFEVGCCPFQTPASVVNTAYDKIQARKFTFVPYGGFDGWDIYRERRTNKDTYTATGTKGVDGLNSGIFATRTTLDGQNGITSDYYAYYEGIKTFSNPESVNINVFVTPGIDTVDNNGLVEEAIDMVETERCDSLYVVTTPDTATYSSGALVNVGGNDIITPEDIADTLYGEFDSNYTATYWPWLQMNDTENNVYIWMPPTGEVVRNIALTDNVAFPWFATAGLNRGVTNAIKARLKLKLADRDTLYENRINPMATFSEEGVVIWGNKTLQIKDSALNRINVRRLLLQARKLISAVSIRLLFEQNDQIVRSQFLSLVNPILENIRKERGLTDFRVQLNDTPESIDRNELNGRIFIKPTRSLEQIYIEFVVTPTGASFENI